jgi:polysaccharide pyruvyl transferase WcaK-like protein
MFGLRDDYNHLAARVIEHIVLHLNGYALLVPHTFGPAGSESDALACRHLYESFKARYPDHVGYLDGEYAHDEVRHILGRCDFFLGSRMHACIAALSQGVPTVAIAYSDKFQQALTPVTGGVTVLDARLLSTNEILQAISDFWENRQSARRVLEQRLPDIQRKVLHLLDAVVIESAP